MPTLIKIPHEDYVFLTTTVVGKGFLLAHFLGKPQASNDELLDYRNRVNEISKEFLFAYKEVRDHEIKAIDIILKYLNECR